MLVGGIRPCGGRSARDSDYRPVGRGVPPLPSLKERRKHPSLSVVVDAASRADATQTRAPRPAPEP